MATLSVLKFATAEGAEQMQTTLLTLQKQQLITIQDAAIVTWPQGAKQPKTKQLANLAGAGAMQGAFWGMLFGLIGQSLVLAGVQRWLSILLGVALLVGLATSRKLAVWLPVPRLVEFLKQRMGALLRQPTVASLLVLGLLNGLLPCGLVYVACAGAAATGSALAGAQYMAVFGLGTVPLMLAISLSGALVPVALRLKLRKAIPVAVSLLGALLILRGMSLGIPYVSPDLAADGTGRACCH